MTISEQNLVEKFRELPVEKQQELLDFADFLLQKTVVKNVRRDPRGALAHIAENIASMEKKPRISSEGILKDLKIDFTTEDLKEVRREMWANFPRDIEL